MSKVVVLGGGVSGLTTALTLVNKFKNEINELTVVSSEFPGDYHAHDYTSPWAGANWASFAKGNEPEQIKRDSLTYKKFMELADTEPSSGIKKFPLKYFIRKNDMIPWYIEGKFVRDIEYLSDDELITRNLNPEEYIGIQFTTVTVTPIIYNNYLIGLLKKSGVIIKRIPRINDIEDIIDVLGYKPDLLINCSGLNAGRLLENLDPEELSKVYPIKGQILQVYQDLPFQMMIDKLPLSDHALPDQFLNVFPRGEGGCIMGGIFRGNDWSDQLIEGLSESIINVVKSHIPEFTSLSVYNTYTALRPGRKGGVRLEDSNYDLLRHDGSLRVIHNYGIGGAGYQSSIGSAEEVSSLAAKILK
ncbi:hypothetical protein Kpol_1018p120 [Vanderwaltozyma polyspora DSM 70294]|uniref:FAD dependent oxidoreductase domain-containing protein n=1 Tax=Vanderwaltozyma polyspora (strain ATCC 22028 / DSM 70294 / BCRC 21397 / CBS 2163 / NBRC 10782 / NRRL Y-8283 / UCD 57-17) TaxID=436907 RepID=A7TDW4_VANPO|nr:uncharacterized protein Kpol_1018p120 [Vanderwaltozyma polyspora DSM 70294]EDO19584.1 hypothetical protein Kpol_1018p120 [Vanderwaltozyma polyspora DSM 70294]